MLRTWTVVGLTFGALVICAPSVHSADPHLKIFIRLALPALELPRNEGLLHFRA